MDQGQPRPPYDCPHEHQILCSRNRTPSPPQRQKLRPWKNRALCWETCEGKLQVRKKSDIQQGTHLLVSSIRPLHNSYDASVDRVAAKLVTGCYLQVQLPERQSQVLLLFDCQGRSDIKTESEFAKTCEKGKDNGDLKVYLPFVKLHLDRLDWFDRMLRFTGQLDNTLYVHKTGILEDGSHHTT